MQEMATSSTVSAQQQSKYTEDWVPVKNIMNGMIQLDNGYYVTGIKVAPKNIFIMDQGTQQNTIYQLRNFYNSIDYEYSYIVNRAPFVKK